MNKLLVALVVIFIFAGGLFLFYNEAVAPQKIPVTETSSTSSISTLDKDKLKITVGGKTIIADVANTPEKTARGLSGRAHLAEDEGMFFVFETSDYYRFWMKDMNFPIDIIWANENYEIVDITHSLATSTYPNVVSPQKPAQYVLEVRAGFSEKNKIMIGEKLLPRE